MPGFKVKTYDVDGSDARRYKTRAAAIKRFEEMVGFSMQAAIDEAFYAAAPEVRPTPDIVRSVSAVSMYGTRVVFSEL